MQWVAIYIKAALKYHNVVVSELYHPQTWNYGHPGNNSHPTPLHPRPG